MNDSNYTCYKGGWFVVGKMLNKKEKKKSNGMMKRGEKSKRCVL